MEQIKKDIIISSLYFLDRFYLNRGLKDKLRTQLVDIISSVSKLEMEWKNTPYLSTRKLKTNFYKPAIFRCILSRTETPQILVPQYFPDFLNEIFKIGADTSFNRCQSIFIETKDTESEETLVSLRISGADLIEKILKLQDQFTSFDLLCYTIPFPSYTGKTGIHLLPFLIVKDIRPVNSPLQLIQADDNDIAMAQKILLEAKEEGVFKYIRRQLIKHINIANLERNPSLDMSLSAVILQAFSDGMINKNTSGKISCLIVGAPGSGKKLISQCSKVLNPVFTQAEPSKLSIAGLCSSTQKRADSWMSKPGLIPLANLGTFNLQDFHIISSAKRQGIIGSLYKVLEDGVVVDSTSAHITHMALTSILIDINKSSDLKPNQSDKKISTIEKKLDDLNIPLPVLSRFDFIVDIPRDINQQIDIAITLHEKNMTFTSSQHYYDNENWTKKLKLLVAYLRQEHRDKLEFSKEIREYIQKKHSELVEAYRPVMVQYEHFSDFLIRSSISIYRFVVAISIMNDRSNPIKEDVDFAFVFVTQKMAYVKSLMEEIEEVRKVNDKLPKSKERKKWILKYFAGKEVKIGWLGKEFEKFYGVKVDPITLRRDLKELLEKGVKSKQKGYYYIPEIREQKISYKSLEN